MGRVNPVGFSLRWRRRRSTITSVPVLTNISTCCYTTSWAWRSVWWACSPKAWSWPVTKHTSFTRRSETWRPESVSWAPSPARPDLPCRGSPPLHPPPRPPPHLPPPRLCLLLRPPPRCPPPSLLCPARWAQRWSSSSTARRPRWRIWAVAARSWRWRRGRLKTWSAC